MTKNNELLAPTEKNGIKLTQATDQIYVIQTNGVEGLQAIGLTKDDIRWLYDETHTTLTHHRLTSGLVSILVNMARTVHEKNRNDIHIYTEIGEVCGPQAYAGMSNISKLRFHALVFKIKGENGKQIKGRWGITKRGGQFLRGEIEIPEFALTKGNHVEGREGKLMHIKALRPEGPLEFEQKEDIRYSSVRETPSAHYTVEGGKVTQNHDPNQAAWQPGFKTDERGQGTLL